MTAGIRLLSMALMLACLCWSCGSSATPDAICRDDQYKYNVMARLSNEVSSCASATGYNFETGNALPSGDQRSQICKKCDSLMEKLSKLYVPRCRLNLVSSTMTLKEFFGSILGECGYGGPKLEPLPKVTAPNGTVLSGGSDSESDEDDVPPAKSKNATAGGSKKSNSTNSSSGSSFDIETRKPTKKPKKKQSKTSSSSSSFSGSGATETKQNQTSDKVSTPQNETTKSGASTIVGGSYCVVGSIVSVAVTLVMLLP